MNRVVRATVEDAGLVSGIGRVAWPEAHSSSASREHLDTYVGRKYTESVIAEELKKPTNRYHLMYCGDALAGFSNLILNAADPNISAANVAELDRLYLLREFHNRKIGWEFLQFNIALAKQHGQTGLWLYVWKGNEKAITFYSKAGFKIIGSHDFMISDSHSNPNHQMFLAL